MEYKLLDNIVELLKIMENEDPTILLTDKDISEFTSLIEILNRNKYRIFTASTAKETISILRKRNVDLLVINAQLEDIPGYKIIPIARDINKDLKVIVTSGSDEADVEYESRKTGIIYFRIKPLNIPELIDVIETAVGKRISECRKTTS